MVTAHTQSSQTNCLDPGIGLELPDIRWTELDRFAPSQDKDKRIRLSWYLFMKTSAYVGYIMHK